MLSQDRDADRVQWERERGEFIKIAEERGREISALRAQIKSSQGDRLSVAQAQYDGLLAAHDRWKRAYEDARDERDAARKWLADAQRQCALQGKAFNDLSEDYEALKKERSLS